MKPTQEFGPDVLDNRLKFSSSFFDRFDLQHAKAPIKLNDQIKKNYLFPTFYGEVTCAIGIFMCSYEKASQMMLHPDIHPVKMPKGRALVAFSNYIYRNVLGVPPYNEIAMTIPVMVKPGINPPVLPMVAEKLFKNSFGYYVFSMPVTSKENELRGHKIWGLPKVVQEIQIENTNKDCVTRALGSDGKPYYELKVPTTGKATKFDVTSNLYSRLDSDLLQSQTSFQGEFKVNKNMGLLFRHGDKPDREYLAIGDGPEAKVLRGLEIEPEPFQFRYAERMSSCFELPNGEYRSKVQFKN